MEPAGKETVSRDMLVVVILLISVYSCSAAITDLNCTTKVAGVDTYTPQAMICNNVQSDAYCNAVYTAMPATSTTERNEQCFAEPKDEFVAAAVASCPKTCAYCCLTPAYNCLNTVPSPLDCSKITLQQCSDPAWRVQIARYCPNVCGLCLEGGCVDAVTDCASQASSICFTADPALRSFATTNCAKTCNTCTSSTGTTSPTTQSPLPGCSDTNPNCVNWVRNGFCTNDFYTLAQRRQYCGRSCNMC